MLRPYRNIILAICIIAFLFRVEPASAVPVIDPDLLNYNSAISSGSGSVVTTEQSITAGLPRPIAISTIEGREFADVWLSGPINLESIRRIGGQVNSVAGNIITARIPLDAVGQLQSLADLERVQLAEAVEFQSDVSLTETGVNALWGGPPPNFSPGGLTGKGVVIGIVDTGIDPAHGDFKTPEGTRIKWLWDQRRSTSAPPAGQTYGSEFSAADLNADPTVSSDTDGHGSHIAGVAAGNGRGTANEQPMHVYMGVAPEADIVAVRLGEINGKVTDTMVLDGVSYVFDRAAALGKPAVVVLALAKMTGPHDGSDPFDLAMTALAGPGKIIVASAGNYGGLSRHAEWTSTAPSQTGDISFQIPGITGGDNLRIEAWYNPTANYDVSVVTPAGDVIGPVVRGDYIFAQTSKGVVYVSNGRFTSPNGSYQVDVVTSRDGPTYVGAGEWKIRLHSQAEGVHRFDAWITSYILPVLPKFLAGPGHAGFPSGMTERSLVASPATANNVVSVAAYSTKRYWTAVNGNTYFFPAARVNDIADFSSPGPRRDGIRVPHLAAPGYSVASTRSMRHYPATMYLMPDSSHSIRYGTSVSAAMMAGTVAMSLQTYPVMTPRQAIQMRMISEADSYTGQVPNDRWGWGKLRPPLAVAGVGDDTNSHLGFALASGNPAHGSMSFQFALSQDDLDHGAQLSIIDVAGREVAILDGNRQAGPQQLTWNGDTSAGVVAPAGVYWAKLRVGQIASTRSFVWLR